MVKEPQVRPRESKLVIKPGQHMNLKNFHSLGRFERRTSDIFQPRPHLFQAVFAKLKPLGPRIHANSDAEIPVEILP